jgi:hypothetical protein
MNRIERLRIDRNRRITFVFGPVSVVKAFRGNANATLVRMSEQEALELYEEFIRRGAERIL